MQFLTTLKRRLETWRIDPYIIMVLLLASVATRPIWQDGYWWGAHDARHSVYFLVEFDRAIQDGVWWPRWSPDFCFGYGYPFFNIYGPLASYIGEFFHLVCNLEFVPAVKMVWALTFLLSGVTMYLFAKRIMGKQAGLIAGVLYVYFPYRMADAYVRASLAESVALIFFPLVLWGFYEVTTRPRFRHIALTGIAYAGLMITHQSLTFLLSLIVAAYVMMIVISDLIRTSKDWRGAAMIIIERLLPVAGAVAIGLGLSAIFWIPALLEFKYVRLDQWTGAHYDFHDNFVQFYQLFSPEWNVGPDYKTPPLQIGVVPIILFIFSWFALPSIRDRERRRHLLFFQILTLVLVFMMLPISMPVWNVIPIASMVQFPWRLLTFVMFSTAFAGSAVVLNFAARFSAAGDGTQAKLQTATYILAAIAIFACLPYIDAEIIEPSEGPVSLGGLMRFQQSANRMTGATIWVEEVPRWSPMADFFVAGKEINSKVDYSSLPKEPEEVFAGPLEYSSVREKVKLRAKFPVTITFNTFYYPGWHAYLYRLEDIDDDYGTFVRELDIVPDEPYGRMTVHLHEPTKKDRWFVIIMQFEDTLPRKVGKAVSAATFVGLIVGSVVVVVWRRGAG